jgi:hypothetical protein
MSISFSDVAANSSPLFDSPEGWGPGFALASGNGPGVVVGPGTDNPNILAQPFPVQPRQFFRVVARARSVDARTAVACIQINWMDSDGAPLAASLKHFEVTPDEREFQHRFCAPDSVTEGILYVAPGGLGDVVRYTEMSLYPEREGLDGSIDIPGSRSEGLVNRSPLFDSPEGWGANFELAAANGPGVVVGPGEQNALGQQFQAQPGQIFGLVARSSSPSATKALGCFQINWHNSADEFLSTSISRFEVSSTESLFRRRVCAPPGATAGVLYVTAGGAEDLVRYTEMSLYEDSKSKSRISDREKAIFVNLARTGGTSLGRSIIEHYDEGEAHTFYPEPVEYDVFGHITADWFLDYLRKIGPQDLEAVKVFMGHLPYVEKARLPFPARYITVLRNPIARVISGYAYGNLNGHALPFDFFSFGLHLSVSWSESSSFQNPMSKVLLCKETIGTADVAAIEKRIEDFDFVGITEDMAWTTDRVLEFLRKGYPTVHHINRTPEVPLSKIHPATIEAIKFRNRLDIRIYNQVCHGHNEERCRTQLPLLEYCPEFDGGAFSSGDYHPDLSAMAAFDDAADTAWLPCTLLYDVAEPYLGYDFGAGHSQSLDSISIQVIGPAHVRLPVALEASDDGFFDDIRPVAKFSIPANDHLHRVRIIQRHLPARMWRIRFLDGAFDREGIAVAALSFGDKQPVRAKDGDLVRNTIGQIAARYNRTSYDLQVEGFRTRGGSAI